MLVMAATGRIASQHLNPTGTAHQAAIFIQGDEMQGTTPGVARGGQDVERSRLPVSEAPCLPTTGTPQAIEAFERLIMDALTRFGNLPVTQVDEEIAAILQLMIENCGFNRCTLMTLPQGRVVARVIHDRYREQVVPFPNPCPISDLFPWSGEKFVRGEIVCFATPDELPQPAAVDRRNYEKLGVHSYLAIPIYVGGAVEYLIAVHTDVAGHIWHNEIVSLVRLVGEILVKSLARCRHDHDVAQRLQFEQLISDLSLRFLNAAPDEIDQVIKAALEQVRDLFRFDRFGLITLSPDKREAFVTHACYGEGIEPVPEKIDISHLFPWAKMKLLAGEKVYFSSIEEVPEEAVVDKHNWLAMGVKTNITIPIKVAGSIDYIIASHDVRASRDLDVTLLPRLRLLGELVVNSLVRCKTEAEQVKSCAEIQRLNLKLQAEAEFLEAEITSIKRHEEIVGQSESLCRALKLAEQVAPTFATVLISGETGTGKELFARAIHRLSQRGKKHLVKVNCAALPSALVESELFGREKGAYTGALTRQAGRFEIADGGTIFLDEIAEMSLELQAKLLRVLQEGQFERLGSTKTTQVDVRIIAATNRDLAEEVKKGRFREDLFYRLNVFQIVVPPLRERIEDIPLLVWSFVNEFEEKMGKKITKISQQDMAALRSYPWPGNVRELRNIIEHDIILSTDGRLRVCLPETARTKVSGLVTLADAERRHIREALQTTGWRIKGEGGAARLLGMNPSTLYSRMQKLGIGNHQVKDEMSP